MSCFQRCRARTVRAFIATATIASRLVAPMPAKASSAFYTRSTFNPVAHLSSSRRIDVTHRQAVNTYDLGSYRSELEYGVTNDIQLGAYVNAFSDRCVAKLFEP